MRLRTCLLLALVPGCAPPVGDGPADPLVVDLVWVPNTNDIAWAEAEAGLWWALSNLGAAPPDASGLVVTESGAEGVRFTLDLGAVGFPEERNGDVTAAVAPIRAWADGPVDLGRFLMATLYEPGRYYAITGACGTLEAWRDNRQASDPGLYAVTLSQLVAGDRLVELNPAATDGNADAAVAGLGWLASEGEGSLADGTFAAHEYETVDVLPNGQQRFAVYGADGALRAAASASPAGQPGKCMWCHETTLQRGTPENPSAPGYLDHAAFLAEVEAAEAWMAEVRARPSAVDFATYEVHEWAERVTIGFLEPSAERVAREWGVDVAEVEALGLDTHVHGEFPEMGDLYDRVDVDAARMDREPGWAPLDTPASDREADPDRPLVGAESTACAPAR